MPVFASYEKFALSVSQAESCALVIGNFDGVHRGHQALIAEARRHATSAGTVIVMTFAPHPAKVLAPQNAPALILSPARKRELLLQSGADVVVEQPFDAAFAQLSATEFVERIILAGPQLRAVCVGHDFRFGRGRAGDGTLLSRLLAETGAVVTVLSAVAVSTPSGEQVTCSSTLIRRALAEGDLDRAKLLLGRPAELEGTVVHGAGRGRTIQVPTANLRCHSEIKLRPGVYAAWAELLAESATVPSSGIRSVEARHPAAVNVGYNRTFQGPSEATASDPPLSVEAHLLVADGVELPSLYDRELRLCFVARLRDERKFPSVVELVTQIRSDIATVRQLTLDRR